MTGLQPLFSFASPAGRRGRLSIFIFHRVLSEPDPLFPDEVDVRHFDHLLRLISRWFQVLPLDAAVRALRQGQLPARAAAITFDDGYADNHDLALPLLKRHGLTATFFIATGYLDGGRMFNDTVIESVRHSRLPVLDLSSLGLGVHPVTGLEQRRQAIGQILPKIKYRPVPERVQLAGAVAEIAGVRPSDSLMMSGSQVQALMKAGMQIGAHTESHPILAGCTHEQAEKEIAGSRSALEALLGERVSLFAYPNGRTGADYLPEQARLVERLGFEAAVTTDWGAATCQTDPFQLPRFTPWGRSSGGMAWRLLRNLRQPGPLAAGVSPVLG